MEIPKRTISKWKKLKERNDVQTLAELAGVSETIISRAFAGNCTEANFIVIRDFYKQRENLLKTA